MLFCWLQKGAVFLDETEESLVSEIIRCSYVPTGSMTERNKYAEGWKFKQVDGITLAGHFYRVFICMYAKNTQMKKL